MRVPFLYKPGIQRDGTDFQDEYCIDGQWIRFVGGKIKKMNGQQELVVQGVDPGIVNNTIYLDAQYCQGNRLFFVSQFEIRWGLVSNQYNITNIATLLTIANSPETTWQSVRFIRDQVACIAFLKTSNASNMSNENGGLLYWKQLTDNENLVNADIGGVANIASGGILYSNPCLYLYGNNGTIVRSRTNDPLNFEGEDSGVYNISADKLIFGANIRGGSNAPSLLFWTANSVIYLTNVADGNLPVDFQKEVITNNSSLMSSRAIIQYDSLFFWLGTDRVFVYNGIVDSVPNTVNLEYFFDNVDLNKRQKIFGYKIARYGELRWAYPEKAYADNPNIGCTRELVYNVRENSWYDTVIQRDCAVVFETTGDIFSYGDACSNYPLNLDNSYKRIWKHEVGVSEIRGKGAILERILGGTASSNTGVSNDNAAGGNPQNAFTEPPSVQSVYTQNPNTNLMYDYGIDNLQTISRIEISNANVDIKQNYRCVVQSSLDLMNWTTLVNQTQNFNPRGTLVFDILQPEPARAYRLLADPNIYVNFIMAFSLKAKVVFPAETKHIPSFFTTPFYGFVTFNPSKSGTAFDKYIVLDQIEPDFPTSYVRTDADELIITVSYKKYAGTTLISTDPIVFKLANLPEAPNLGKIDFRVQGRFINITFSCNYPYNVGTVLLNFKEGDSQ